MPLGVACGQHDCRTEAICIFKHHEGIQATSYLDHILLGPFTDPDPFVLCNTEREPCLRVLLADAQRNLRPRLCSICAAGCSCNKHARLTRTSPIAQPVRHQKIFPSRHNRVQAKSAASPHIRMYATAIVSINLPHQVAWPGSCQRCVAEPNSAACTIQPGHEARVLNPCGLLAAAPAHVAADSFSTVSLTA